MLAARLKKVLRKIISKNHSAFIPGRKMLNGILVAKIIDLAVRSKKKCMILKVDFEKSYDNVSRNFFIPGSKKLH